MPVEVAASALQLHQIAKGVPGVDEDRTEVDWAEVRDVIRRDHLDEGLDEAARAIERRGLDGDVVRTRMLEEGRNVVDGLAEAAAAEEPGQHDEPEADLEPAGGGAVIDQRRNPKVQRSSAYGEARG